MDRTTRDQLIDDALINLEHGIDWNWRDQVNAIRQLRIHAASAEAEVSALTAKLEAAEQENKRLLTAAMQQPDEPPIVRLNGTVRHITRFGPCWQCGGSGQVFNNSGSTSSAMTTCLRCCGSGQIVVSAETVTEQRGV